MSQRGNGEGTVYQRKSDGAWCYSWREDTPDGMRRRVKYAKTEAAAKRELKTVIRRLDAGRPGADAKMKFRTFAETWRTTTLQVADVKPSTRRTYESALRVRVLPTLGDLELRRIKTTDIERLLVGAADRSAQTRRTAYTVVRLILDTAVRDGLLASNPAAEVGRPGVEQGTSRFLNRDEVRAIRAEVAGTRLEPLVTLLCFTGLRVGEALALRWADVDLEGGSLKVTATLVRLDGGLVRSSTKSDRSKRAVALPAPLVASLKAWKVAQTAERLAATVWFDEDWLFTTPIGTATDHSNVSKAYKAAATKAGVPTATFHGLRHAAATVMLEEGVPMRVVADVLGHSSTRLTADTYSHVTPRLTQEAANALARGLDG